MVSLSFRRAKLFFLYGDFQWGIWNLGPRFRFPLKVTVEENYFRSTISQWNHILFESIHIYIQKYRVFFNFERKLISLFRTFPHARRLKIFVQKPQYIIFMTLNFQLDWMYLTLFSGPRHFRMIFLIRHLKYAYNLALIHIV